MPILAEEVLETIPEVAPETAITEQSIITGEAVAKVESNNEVNNNLAVTEGSVNGCQLEINCSNQNNNSANLEIGNSVAATTGENQSTNSDNTEIKVNTGEATAAITNQNQVNTNTLEVATTMVDVGETEMELVENNNQAEVTIENNSVAATGENNVETNNGDVLVNTGNAIAYANVINLINTNVVGTNLGIYVVNNFDQEWVDLDLNQMWLKLINGNGVTIIESGTSNKKMVIISNKNLAKLNNVVTVSAVTGGNIVTGGNEVLILTGEAVAVANVINLVNTNLVGGQFFIGVVNVLGENLGNVVLPNPNNFQNNESVSNDGSVVINNNQAVLDNTVVAESNSGNNTTVNVNQSEIGTRETTTYSSDLSVVNLNAELNNQMWLQLNVLGETSGKIYNWSYPGSVEEINNGQLLFVLNENGCLNCQGGNDLLINNNLAEVTNSVLVTADSGGNQILGASDGVIESGSATAIANLTNLLNVNIYGSDWFWGIINILGNWGGDVIFAYPDLAVNLTANKNESRSGEEIVYRINYSNLGYEKVDEAELKINLPVGLNYVSDDSGWLLTQEGNKLKWKLNNVAAKSGGGFNLKVKINNLNDDRDVQLQTVAVIATNLVESDLNNNQSVWLTIVWHSVRENNSQNQENKNNASDRETKIVVEAKNNVNDYVLPDDTVTFLIEVKNVGEGKMKEAILFHQVFDGQGFLWSGNSLYLGDIDINKVGKMAFGLVMSEAGGKYTTRTWIVGLDENNKEVSSNVAETNFWVKRKIVLERGQVLGTENDTVYEGPVNNGTCVVKKEKLIYVLLLLVSLMYIQRQVGIWRKKLK